MTPEQLQSFQVGQGDPSLGPGDRGVGESLQDFETRRFGQQRFSSQSGQGFPCGRPGQPPCFGTAQGEPGGVSATVFDEVPDEIPGSTTAPLPAAGATIPQPNTLIDPLTFEPQGFLQGGGGAGQIPLPSISRGPSGFIPSPAGPDAGVGRRRLAGQLTRSPGAGGGSPARSGGIRRPGSTLQPRRQAPVDPVKKRLLSEMTR